MCRTTHSDQTDARLRRAAVKLYRAGLAADEVGRKLNRSRAWVYKWVNYRRQHPWTRFRSASRAPHHRPNQTLAVSERRIVRLRQQLVRRTQPRLRFPPVGPRSIQREWRKRYDAPPPSLSTIQRVLHRRQLTASTPPPRRAYRPHPAAEYPNAVHATDLITRWLTGGQAVQTFNTVDIYSNDACSTSRARKTTV